MDRKKMCIRDRFHSLKDKRNQMLKEGKDTELVDDVLIDVYKRQI